MSMVSSNDTIPSGIETATFRLVAHRVQRRPYTYTDKYRTRM